MPIQQAEIAKNIDEIQAQAVELNKQLLDLHRKVQCHWPGHHSLDQELQRCAGLAQSRLLPEDRRFLELAGQNGQIDVADQIDEVRRKIQAGE